ncbi:MAG: type II toxin-antitoxin system VapC family toxin [Proteobacteria bacterium]|nr:type II toxin-antitoxin system VapC family toxin [Pseudomonadota bacterium]
MLAVDTNILVRLIARDDEQQTHAAERAVRSGGWISQLVLAETLWVLTSVYSLDRAKTAETVALLLNHSTLTIQDYATVEAALEQFRKNPNVDFSGCLVLEIARKAGHLPLATFDRALGKCAGTQRL